MEFLRRISPSVYIGFVPAFEEALQKTKAEKEEEWQPQDAMQRRGQMNNAWETDPGSKGNKNSTGSLKLGKYENTEAWRKGLSCPPGSTKTKKFTSITQF